MEAVRRHIALVAAHRRNGINKVAAHRAFHYISLCANVECPPDVILLLMRGQHNDRDRRVLLNDYLGRLVAAQAWQLDIHQHDVRLHFVNDLYGFTSVSYLYQHLECRVDSQDDTYQFPYLWVVVHDNDFTDHGVTSRHAVNERERPGRSLSLSVYQALCAVRVADHGIGAVSRDVGGRGC